MIALSDMLDLSPLVGHSNLMTLNAEANTLEDFILNRMRMSHIYQPVMLKVLLEGNVIEVHHGVG